MQPAATEPHSSNEFDVAVIGAGPAGLACALNLVRAHVKVVLIDANRPRHAATLRAHGFITRDGISPLELRRLGREEFLQYQTASFMQAKVSQISGGVGAFTLALESVRGAEQVRPIKARRVVVATGLSENLPEVANLRAYYGTSLHSCIVCDGYEKTDKSLVFIPHAAAPAEQISAQIKLLQRFSAQVSLVSDAVEILGERAQMMGVRTADGALIAAEAGFVLPVYMRELTFLDGLHGAGDDYAKIPGVYLVGEALTGEPAQLLVAAGSGAAAVPQILREL